MPERELNPPEFYYQKHRNGYCDKCCEFDHLVEVENNYWLCFECRNENNEEEEIKLNYGKRNKNNKKCFKKKLWW